MEEKKSILIIDDESSTRNYLNAVLAPHYNVLMASDGVEGLNMVKSQQPDIVLLDINMPRLNGVQTCDALRSAEGTRHIPVMILTGQDNSTVRTEVFTLGADDYITKPCEPKEMLARISSKLKRLSEMRKPEALVRCGNLVLNMDSFEATIDGQLIDLTALEFKLMTYLIRNKQSILSREQILNAIWNDTVVCDRTVDTHISFLRKKLERFDHVIKTIYSVGYIIKPKKP